MRASSRAAYPFLEPARIPRCADLVPGHGYHRVMAVTYGEQMLAKAEGAVRRRSARRRTARLLVPFVIASLWSIADLAAARSARLSIGGAGSIRIMFDHTIVAIWGLAFVVAPMFAALKREPLISGAALSLVAGPIATPL